VVELGVITLALVTLPTENIAPRTFPIFTFSFLRVVRAADKWLLRHLQALLLLTGTNNRAQVLERPGMWRFLLRLPLVYDYSRLCRIGNVRGAMFSVGNVTNANVMTPD
jgi:hypothetical protein